MKRELGDGGEHGWCVQHAQRTQLGQVSWLEFKISIIVPTAGPLV